MAELLIQGKVGTELEKEILEKTASVTVESGSDRSSAPGYAAQFTDKRANRSGLAEVVLRPLASSQRAL